MKKCLLIWPILISLYACSDNNDIIVEESVSGEINGKSFLFKSARVTETEDGKLLFEVFNEGVPGLNACGLLPTDIHLFFTSENTEDRQELFLDLMNFEGFTVSLFDPEANNNIIASEGFFEITKRTSEEIEGILDVKANDTSYVKGGFTAVLCE